MPPLFRLDRLAKNDATEPSKSSARTLGVIVAGSTFGLRNAVETRRTARMAASFTIASSSAPLHPLVANAIVDRSTALPEPNL